MHAFHPSSDFAAHFGNLSPNPRTRDWSTTTKIVSPHNCIQHIEAMHLYPKLGAKTRMILFFTSARTTQWFFYWLPYLFCWNQFVNPRNSSTQPRVDGLTNSNSSTLKTLAPGSISMKLIRQPDNPTTRQPDRGMHVRPWFFHIWLIVIIDLCYESFEHWNLLNHVILCDTKPLLSWAIIRRMVYEQYRGVLARSFHEW